MGSRGRRVTPGAAPGVNPEVRMLAERASARRLALLGLVEVVPGDYWSRREPGEPWTARNHLEHVATADALLRDAIAAACTGEPLSVPYEARRAHLMTEVAPAQLAGVLERMTWERSLTTRALDRLPGEALDAVLMLPGVVDQFGRATAWPLRQLLTAWAEHDTVHEHGIRLAVTAPPDAGALAVATRLR